MRLPGLPAALVAVILALSVLGCASTASSPATRSTAGVTAANRIRLPAARATFQYQLSGTIDTSVKAQVFSIDGEQNNSSVVAGLHHLGRMVMCYIDVGTWESDRPDAGNFPASVIGNPYQGYPDERWLDIRQTDLLAPVIRARMDMCKTKGFDGIEPDNVDGYESDTGFPLTPEDQLAFNRFIAREAHLRGLSVGLKNDVEQSAALVDMFDWALSEECFERNECEQLQPFLSRGKAVFVVEYTVSPSQFCSAAKALGITAIRKRKQADAWVESCPDQA